MKIKTRLAICFVAIATVPVLLIATLVVSNLRKQAVDNFVDSSTREIRQVDLAFTQFFSDIAENVGFFTKHPSLQSIDANITSYVNSDGSSEMTPDTKGGVETDVFKLFAVFASTHPAFSYIYTGTKEGGFIQWPKGKTTPNYDPRKRPWYQKAIAAPGTLQLTDAYYWAPDDAVLVSTVLSYDTKLGKDSAAMGIDVSLKKLTDVVKNIHIGEHGYLMLVENTGNVLVDPAKPAHNFKKLDSLGSAYASLAASGNDSLMQVELDGVPYMATVYRSPKLGWRFIGLIPSSEVYAQANKLSWMILVITVALAVVFAFAGYLFAGMIVKPIKSVSNGLREIAQGEGDLTRMLPVTSNDETAELATLFNQFVGSIRGLIQQIGHTANEVKQASVSASAVSHDMADNARRQRSAVDNASSAFHEVASSSNDVAQACNAAAGAADSGQAQAREGEALIGEAVSRVTRLSDEIRQAAEVIGQLEQNSQDIANILGTIKAVAEQTNLLALNASIEAARAGEQGRGFAVVADEVRLLAERTAAATLEINTMLERLTSGTRQVVQTMETSRSTSDQVVGSIEQVTSSFGEIMGSVDRIRDMNTRIASAAEEQHQVARNIDENMVQIHEDAGKVADVSERARDNATQLERLADDLKGLVGRFRV